MRRRLSKKAVSPVIGYILLIGFVIGISLITFQWVKTYIPKEALQCPDGVSMFIQDFEYDCKNKTNPNLTLSLKNNGRFNIVGYFIKASPSELLVATQDLSYFIESGGNTDRGKVNFYTAGSTDNNFKPGDAKTSFFNLPLSSESYVVSYPLRYIEIIPIRYEEIDNKLRLSSCGDAKIQQALCTGACSPVSSEALCVPNFCSVENDGCGGTIYCDGVCTDGASCILGACSACDGVQKDDNEICDGAHLDGQTCEGLGFGPGSLSCEVTCDGFVTSGCGPALLPDLNLTLLYFAVPSCSYDDSCIGSSDRSLVTVYYKIGNEGTTNADNVYVNVTTGAADSEDQYPQSAVPESIPVGSETAPPAKTISWRYPTTNPPSTYSAILHVNADREIIEPDYSNNNIVLGDIECIEQSNKIECSLIP